MRKRGFEYSFVLETAVWRSFRGRFTGIIWENGRSSFIITRSVE
jgi:hypothetical protein